MGTSLNGLTPANTYQALIKVGNNTNLNTTLKTLSDGAGNDLPMQASTTEINFTGTVSGVASGVSGAIQFSNGSAFASDANNLFWDDTNNRLGVGTNTPSTTLDVVGQTTFSDNALFSTDFKSIGRDLNNSSISFASINSQIRANISTGGNFVIYNAGIGQLRFGVSAGGQTTIIGGGSTSATTSLLVQNSAGVASLQVTDDQMVRGYSGTQIRFRLGATLAGQGVSTRDGEFAVGFIDSNQSSCLRLFVASSTAFSYIDGYTEGASKAQNYAIIFGSRANNTGAVITGTTTQENGSPVVFGSAVYDASALVQINSTTRGFLPPRMTNAQRSAIASPAEGLQIHNTTNNGVAYYDGTNWGYLSGAKQSITITGATQTIFGGNGNIVALTMQSSTTLTFSNHVVGTYIFQITQGGTGSYTITWPVSVLWSGGTAPTLTTTVGKTDIVTLFHDGTNFYGTYSLNY